MYSLVVSHIPSTLLHVLTGMLLMDIFFSKYTTCKRKRLILLLSGGTVVLIPDIPKLLGVPFTHSLFFVPILSFVLAYIFKEILPASFIRRWIGIMSVLFIGAVAIDFFGNGAHIFYPVTDGNYSFPLIRNEWWLSLFIFIYIVIRLTLSKA